MSGEQRCLLFQFPFYQWKATGVLDRTLTLSGGQDSKSIQVQRFGIAVMGDYSEFSLYACGHRTKGVDQWKFEGDLHGFGHGSGIFADDPRQNVRVDSRRQV